ncbi:MAG: hypothetical protein U5R06_14410 [candidate division KSB1 bacterium]|nr:hypothetical protein [candidate division KSB1 bacterium]
MGLSPYSKASWEDKLNYPQAALVAIDTQTGAVKALVGGRRAGAGRHLTVLYPATDLPVLHSKCLPISRRWTAA